MSKAGSQADRIDRALSTKPQTVAQLAQAADVTTQRARQHLAGLVKKGLVQAVDGKYRTIASDTPQGPQMPPVASQAKPAKALARAKTRRANASSGPAAPSRAISTRMPAVRVEYDGRYGFRKAKHFVSPHEARHFYATKLLAGKNPSVKKPE